MTSLLYSIVNKNPNPRDSKIPCIFCLCTRVTFTLQHPNFYRRVVHFPAHFEFSKYTSPLPPSAWQVRDHRARYGKWGDEEQEPGERMVPGWRDFGNCRSPLLPPPQIDTMWHRDGTYCWSFFSLFQSFGNKSGETNCGLSHNLSETTWVKCESCCQKTQVE